jgi:hypothetical protein
MDSKQIAEIINKHLNTQEIETPSEMIAAFEEALTEIRDGIEKEPYEQGTLTGQVSLLNNIINAL